MSNPYYIKEFDATGGQLARSRQIAREFALVQRGFDTIALVNGTVKYQLSLSDLTSNLQAGAAKAYMRVVGAFTLTGVRASLIQASSSGPVQTNILINGAAALFLPLQIDALARTSIGSVSTPSIAIPAIPDDAEVTFTVVNAGSNAKGLIVTLLGTRLP